VRTTLLEHITGSNAFLFSMALGNVFIYLRVERGMDKSQMYL
jgi:hypothetical protein